MLGQSSAMLKLYDQLARIAESDASVLITGESGTGKELVAKPAPPQPPRREAVRRRELRALPDTLLESELFGHVKKRRLPTLAPTAAGCSGKRRVARSFWTRSARCR